MIAAAASLSDGCLLIGYVLPYPFPQVFNKERTQRAKQAREAGAQFSDKPAGNEENTHALSPGRPRAHTTSAQPTPRRVDSIVEDEEEPYQAGSTTMSATVTEPPRVRQASKSFTSASAAAAAAAARYRSVSIPHPRHEHRRSQDQLANGAPVPPRIDTQNGQKLVRQNPKSTPAGMPSRTRKLARNRESLDLDDVMNGSGDEEEEVVSPSAPPRTPSRVAGAATPITPVTPRTPHVSASAQELIAFLDEGPPVEIDNPRTSVANASVISFESSKTARAGKLSRMMSRLSIKNGGSTERLNGRLEDAPKTPTSKRTLGRKPSTGFGPPPTAYNPAPANKRSFPSVVVSPPRLAPYHGHGHGDGMQTPTPPQSISSGTRGVSPSPTASTAPLIPRTVSAASSTSDESQALSLRTRKGSAAAWDEFGSPSSMSRDSSLRAQVANGSRRLRVMTGDAGEAQEDRPLAVKTNGYVVEPAPVNNDDRIVSPTTPRRSPIPRKPAPSHVHENGRPLATRETPLVSRKPSATALPPGPPAIVASDVADLRKYLQRASTPDECRLLVDMFFASHGFPAKPLSDDAAPTLPELPRFMSLSGLDASYAEMFLTPDHIDFHSLADETSSEGSAASSRDFVSPSSEASLSPPPVLATVQE